jgi:hypothetical protein
LEITVGKSVSWLIDPDHNQRIVDQLLWGLVNVNCVDQGPSHPPNTFFFPSLFPFPCLSSHFVYIRNGPVGTTPTVELAPFREERVVNSRTEQKRQSIAIDGNQTSDTQGFSNPGKY